MHFALRSILLSGVCGAWGAAMLAGAPASAENATADNQNQGRIEEIIVTAQKRRESLRDVPLAVQAIQPDQIEKSGAQNVTDLVQQIPGASVVSSTGPGFATIQIRGIASGNFGDGLTGFYVDDTAFGIPNIQLAPPGGLLDIARVEVIRGPSGTLYGQGSMGGTIKLITNQPDSHRFSGQAFGEGSSTTGGAGNYDGGGVLNLPIIEDRLAVRASGEYSFLSGYASVPDVKREHANSLISSNARIAELWTPTDDVSVAAFYWYTRDALAYTTAVNTITPPQILGTGTGTAAVDTNLHVTAATVNWNSPIGDVVAASSYFDHKLVYDEPFTTSVVALGLTFGLPSLVDDTFKTHQFTQELRVASKDASPVRWLLGAFYRDATINSDLLLNIDESIFGLGNVPLINFTGPLTTRSWSGYGEVSMPFFDGKLEPLVGVRYFSDHRTFGGVNYIDYPRTASVPEPASSANFDSTNPRFNLKYKPLANGLVYVDIAKGFRSGTIQTLAQANLADIALNLPPGTVKQQVSPDSMWTYQLGTRWELANTVVVEAGVYHTDWHDIIVQFSVPTVGDFLSVVNGGDARINGGDFGVTWRTPLTGLNLSMNGNVQDARVDKIIPALAASTNYKYGAKLPSVPDETFLASLDYAHGLSWFGDSIGSLYAAYAFRNRLIDPSATATPGGVPVQSGQLNELTLRAGIKRGAWSVDAFVYNALNDHGPATGQLNTPATPVILYPRRAGLRVTVNF
jgi:iron complex outermembrane receptor protein